MAAASQAEEERWAAALRVWKRLSRRRKLEVVHEVVDVRANELRLAFTGVRSVLAGFGTCQQPRGRSRRLRRREDPCITFVVGGKWPRRGGPPPSFPVPDHLLTYVMIGTKSSLCAVPTDVEDSADYRVTAQQNAAIASPCDGVGATFGSLACVIRRPDDPDLWAIGCRHVVAGSTLGLDDYPTGGKLALANQTAFPNAICQAPAFAEISDFYGPLVPIEPVSFDAALVRIMLAGDQLHQAAGRFASESAFARSIPEISRLADYVLWTLRGNVPATYIRAWPISEQLPIQYGSIQIRHGVVLIESLLDQGQTAPGFSGSPVVSRSGTLLGMHIAGDGARAFMIPAFELLRPSNYVGLASGPPFKLATNF